MAKRASYLALTLSKRPLALGSVPVKLKTNVVLCFCMEIYVLERKAMRSFFALGLNVIVDSSDVKAFVISLKSYPSKVKPAIVVFTAEAEVAASNPP